jgi:hypothetical protein
VKEDDEIHAFQRSEHFGAVELAIDWARGAFERADARVAVHCNDKCVAKRTSLLQVTDVADMQDVEAAVRKNERLSAFAKRGADDGEFSGCFYLFLRHNSRRCRPARQGSKQNGGKYFD